MIVVSDTSSISGLLQIGHLDLLKKMYSIVLIPPAVYNELLALQKRNIDLSIINSSSWITIVEVRNNELVLQLRKSLDAGESEAIALALEQKADVLLIDETDGRAIAKKYGLHIVGLLGILVEAKQ